ncbi:MAG: methyltransferase [Bacteriovoracaceae bacterium]|nr:methyltransferase [Bacteriovoracaceae bacterium]
MSGCRYFDQGLCRSCSVIDVDPAKTLESKSARLQKATGLIPENPFHSTPWHFRDKVKLTVAGTTEKPIIGLLQENLTDCLELHDCPVQAQELNSQIPTLIAFIKKWNLTPYNILERKGELKGLILSWSPTTQQKMLRFVLRSKESLDRIRLGLSELKGFHLISINLQPTPHALLEGSEEIILSDSKFIEHLSGEITLAYSPQSFMQTNSSVAESLYQTAVDWLKPWRDEKVLDLFCGVGGFSLHLSKAGHESFGIEINASAIHLAQQMAKKQNLKAQFLASKAEDVKQNWMEWNPKIVIANPPRRGLAGSVDDLCTLLPEVFLYSSCSIESLESDLKRLENHFNAVRTKIFDMFPYTNHFESLTLLVRR